MSGSEAVLGALARALLRQLATAKAKERRMSMKIKSKLKAGGGGEWSG